MPNAVSPSVRYLWSDWIDIIAPLSVESCAFVLEVVGQQWVYPVVNQAEKYGYDPQDSFYIDEIELLFLWKHCEKIQGRVVAFVHTHINRPAALSADDGRFFFLDGAPRFPDVAWWVVSMVGGRFHALSCYSADDALMTLRVRTPWQAQRETDKDNAVR